VKSAVDLVGRVSCVRRIGDSRDAIAQAAMGALRRRCVEVPDGHGAGVRAIGIHDAGVHVDFLMGAIAAASPEAFADYARWCVRVMEARGHASQVVADSILEIRDQVSAALPACAPVIAEVADAGVEACNSPRATVDAQRAGGVLGQAQRLFTQAALRGDRRAAAGIAAATLHDGASMVDLFTGVFEASQREAGKLWERNQISVAEEHMATAVTQYVMAHVFGEAPLASRARGKVVVTGVEGELHQIGPNMVADVLALDGWDVHFLGTNVPQRDILSTVDREQPSILAISATMLSGLPATLALIDAVRARMGPSAPLLLVGGAAFRRTSDIFREIGCEGYAPDLQSARALVDRLFPAPSSGAEAIATAAAGPSQLRRRAAG
jgi:methanogenic corrinoid protein MtbC1